MKVKARTVVRKLAAKAGFNEFGTSFRSNHYLRHNSRRLEHLASLGIPVANMTVLEVGAGIGDLSSYYLDRGCKLTITEVRSKNIKYLRARYPDQDVQYLDIENPVEIDNSPFDIVHCYGLLYHLSDPEQALKFLAKNTRRILFLETCVSYGESKEINLTVENQHSPTQAYSGMGCRPTRPWLFNQLQVLFDYVYIPKTQPNHEEFPLDWNVDKDTSALKRAVFIASREALDHEILTSNLISNQIRHE